VAACCQKRHLQDDLHLCLDDQSISHCEAVQHLGQLHELLPAPVMLLLAKSVQRVCQCTHTHTYTHTHTHVQTNNVLRQAVVAQAGAKRLHAGNHVQHWTKPSRYPCCRCSGCTDSFPCGAHASAMLYQPEYLDFLGSLLTTAIVNCAKWLQPAR